MSLPPEGWASAHLGDLLREPLRNGHSAKATGTSIGVRTLTLSAITQGDFSVRNTKLTVADPAKVSDLWARSGDIFIERSNTPELVGTARLYVGSEEFAIFPDLVIRARTVKEALPSYVAHFLQTLRARRYFQKAAQGISGSMPKIGQGTIEELELPISPLPEQHRIVEALDSYLTRLDAAEQALLRAQANLKRYRASVLKAAVEGRLVPTEAELARQEGREYEPASVLLARILAERKLKWEKAERAKMKAKGIVPKDDRWKAEYEEPTAPDLSELSELPEGWCWTTIGRLFDVSVGATPSRSVQEFWGGGIPWVSSGEVGFCRIRETRETISASGLANSSTKLNPPGTVLIGMIGEGRTRGQVAILDIAACNNQNSAGIRVSEAGLSPEFVYYFLMSQYSQNRRLGLGGNQLALNKSRVSAIPIPLPPLAEQRAIAVIVDDAMQATERIETTILADLARIARLRQSILKWAFEGKLVDQDPNDEPAAELLARIRAAREKSGARKRQPWRAWRR